MPFSLHCCCPSCRECPCRAGSVPAALVAIFDDWTSSPDGYCSDCDPLNGTYEIPWVEAFNIGTDLGDAYQLTSIKTACAVSSPGEGCRYEADYPLDCVPQACLEECFASCGDECTEDSHCAPENCENFGCGGNFLCQTFGPTCEMECDQASVCVFNDDVDPQHQHGSCATVGDCTPSIAPDTCPAVTLRVRALLYVSDDLTPVLSVFVALFGRHASGERSAILLRGWHEFEPGALDCGEIDVEIDLEPMPAYVQPPTPPCGATTKVRIVGLLA